LGGEGGRLIAYPDRKKYCELIDKHEARNWIEKFVLWYNDEHQHSAIKFVTPNQRHKESHRASEKESP